VIFGAFGQVSAEAAATASDAAPISTVMRTIKENLLMALSYRPLGANQRFLALVIT
jgi:hypothetical protein